MCHDEKYINNIYVKLELNIKKVTSCSAGGKVTQLQLNFFNLREVFLSKPTEREDETMPLDPFRPNPLQPLNQQMRQFDSYHRPLHELNNKSSLLPTERITDPLGHTYLKPKDPFRF